ncbi:DUF4212 domain-containing protein [Microaerobacter geothermalis]|uniref:DUF4212 domain-containing protein n=1 Tax=Microaerobacter geothermalis TaxID=674972 RepID=UPI001F382B9E|nr:DUF4212 domain-containing protein [Microaerobacter geothermalis]MCF6094975.1 DUF4212 domain-containing protein [Microaerobacter geothermalis]
MSANHEQQKQEYWKKNIALIRNLLIIWAVVSYLAAIILAKPFSDIQFFGVPLSFWFAQQGSILVFVVLIFYYAKRMDRLDQMITGKAEVSSTKPGKGVSS